MSILAEPGHAEIAETRLLPAEIAEIRLGTLRLPRSLRYMTTDLSLYTTSTDQSS